MQFDMLKEDASIIKVIGVGGGGGNAINHMFKQGIKGVDFIICNTDAQALELSPIPNKIQLGATLTEGRGAGSIPEVGKHSAIENIDQLKAMLGNTRMVFITAGMGGGTGTGASPIIAQACKELGILTVGIVTTPFAFEGKRRRSQAEEGLEELKKNVDTLLVVSNDKLREMFGNLTLSNAFGEADDILTTAAKGIAEIITVPGYINVDFEDVRTVMKESGAAIMGSCTAKGEDRAKKAVIGALSSPLLNDNEIEGARYILLNISSGKNEVLMDEVTIITDYIQEEAGLTADIIWGNCNDESLEDELCVTIIATGFQTRKEKESIKQRIPERIVKNLEDEQEKFSTKRIVHSLEMDEPYIQKETITRTHETYTKEEETFFLKPETPCFGADEEAPSYEPFLKKKEEASHDPFLRDEEEEEERNIVQKNKLRQVSIFDLEQQEKETPEEKSASVQPPIVFEKPATLTRPPVMPAMDDEDPMRKTKERIMRLKELSMKLRTPKGLEDLENEPAYLRKKMKFDNIPSSSSNDEISRYTTDDRGEIRPNNSFLHDNVD